ncbi:MAG: DUF2914 domain-containing protein [Myxococcales bacterium]|nr:DUF2914 domain-containing protein [Myxococcales bacterium]
MNSFRRMMTSAVLVSASLALAQDPAAPAKPSAPPPTADEIKRVMEYQDNGKDRGPALLDVIICTKVDQTKGSETIYTCIEPLAGNHKKDTVINAWMQFFVPKGGEYEDLKIQWLFNSEVRETKDFKIKGLARARTWLAHTPKKAGKWTVKVLQGEANKELGSASFTVE